MEIPINHIRLDISIDQNNDLIQVKMDENLSPEMPEEQEIFFLDLCNGLMSKLQTEAEAISYHGWLIRQISMLEDELYEENEGLHFEPDEELIKSLKKRQKDNILNFKKKMH